MTVAEMIKKTRTEANMTQGEYGAKFGVSRQTVSSWENGRSLPDLQMLIDICNTYHVSLDKLLNEDKEFVEKIDFYNKRHLFTLAGEDKVYTKGTEKVIVNYKNWNICLQICYDLRFPVFVRNVENYDLLLYVANWPKPRINAWDTLLKSRAIENMCYTIGVNRIGEDANKLEYPGHSQVIDFLGNQVINCENESGVYIINLDKQAQLEAREKFSFLNDRDDFSLI